MGKHQLFPPNYPSRPENQLTGNRASAHSSSSANSVRLEVELGAQVGHYFVDPPLIVNDDARVRHRGCVPSIARVGRYFHETMNAGRRHSIWDQVFELALRQRQSSVVSGR
jgi:hypothetical protein